MPHSILPASPAPLLPIHVRPLRAPPACVNATALRWRGGYDHWPVVQRYYRPARRLPEVAVIPSLRGFASHRLLVQARRNSIEEICEEHPRELEHPEPTGMDTSRRARQLRSPATPRVRTCDVFPVGNMSAIRYEGLDGREPSGDFSVSFAASEDGGALPLTLLTFWAMSTQYAIALELRLAYCGLQDANFDLLVNMRSLGTSAFAPC